MQPVPVYHDGERLVQERAGEGMFANSNGRVIETTIPRAALGFIRQQPMAVATTIDPEGRPRPSILFGEPGFLAAEDPAYLEVDFGQAWLHPEDPLRANLLQESAIGLLFIELATRRRLRVNGRATVNGNRLGVEVLQAYPNCPKYIQRRHLRRTTTGAGEGPGQVLKGDRLADDQQELIARADTIFVSSWHPQFGADASHRGGSPGFIEVLNEGALRIPDYRGNSMFNTLGNFAEYPRGGVLVPDFQGRRLLQLVGEVDTLWNVADPEDRTGGTGRFWDLHVQEVLELPMAPAASWEYLDASPFNP